MPIDNPAFNLAWIVVELTDPPLCERITESEKDELSVEISKLFGAVNVISASRLEPETVVD